MKNVVLLIFLIVGVIVFAVIIRKNSTESGNFGIQQSQSSGSDALATPSVFPSVQEASKVEVGKGKTIEPEY